MEALEERSLLTSYIVTTVNDLLHDTTAGEVTLRDVLTAINTQASSGNAAAGSASNTIKFAIGGVGTFQTINVTSPLPALTHHAFVEGWSQGGAKYAGPPRIVLNGAGAGLNANGLEFDAGSNSSTVRGLVIQQFSANGIEIKGASKILVLGNYLGTDANGAGAVGNLHNGILLDGGATNNIIGGIKANLANVISGNGDSATNSGNGVEIAGAGTNANTVLGNLIGTDKTGSVPLANIKNGILIDQGASGNTIGGAKAGAANVICGSFAGPPSGIVGTQGAIFALSPASINGTIATFDVTLNYTDAVPFQMVYVGIDPRKSSSALAPVDPGTGQPDFSAFRFTPSSTIGTNWGEVGNAFPGEFLFHTPLSTGGPKAGLDPNADYFVGTLAYDLARFGITPDASLFVSIAGADTTIGAEKPNDPASFNFVNPTFTTAQQPLVNAAAATAGVEINGAGTNGNMVLGNRIGVNTHNVAVGHQTDGVRIEGGACQNIVGGTTLLAGNVIGGNANGVVLDGTGTDNNNVLGNRIGTDRTDALNLANTVVGILVEDGASGNTVGGTTRGTGNVIAFNGKGVVIGNSATDTATIHDAILGNTIFANVVSAIELGNQGPTANGANPRAYPNDGQNTPLLAVITPRSIGGSLSSVANTSYRIEFFAIPVGGVKPGQTFLGFVTVMTDGAGAATFTLPIKKLPLGNVVTATATNLSNGDTSESSPIGTQIVILANPRIPFSNMPQIVPVKVQILTADGPPTQGEFTITITGIAGEVTIPPTGKSAVTVNFPIPAGTRPGLYGIVVSLLNSDHISEFSGLGLLTIGGGAARRWQR